MDIESCTYSTVLFSFFQKEKEFHAYLPMLW